MTIQNFRTAQKIEQKISIHRDGIAELERRNQELHEFMRRRNKSVQDAIDGSNGNNAYSENYRNTVTVSLGHNDRVEILPEIMSEALNQQINFLASEISLLQSQFDKL